MPTEPEGVVANLAEAVNRRDVEAVMAIIAGDATVTIPALSGRQGRDEIEAFFEFCAGIGVSWEVSDTIVHGDAVTCQVAQRDGWADLVGVAPLVYETMTIMVRNGRVAGIEGQWSSETLQRLGSQLESFTPWAVEHHPELYTEDGDFRYTREAGEGFIRAAEEWVSFRSG
jgi:hypothetical protein